MLKLGGQLVEPELTTLAILAAARTLERTVNSEVALERTRAKIADQLPISKRNEIHVNRGGCALDFEAIVYGPALRYAQTQRSAALT